MKRYLVVFDNKDRCNRNAGVEVIDQEQYDKLMDKDKDNVSVGTWWYPEDPNDYIDTLKKYRKYIKVNEITEDEYKLLKRIGVHAVGNTMLDDVFDCLDDCEDEDEDDDLLYE